MKTILPSSSSATAARQSSAGAVLILVYISLTVATVNGQSLLLKDINTREDIQSNEFRALTRGDGVMYLNAYDQFLWRSDGTACRTFPIDLGPYATNVLERISSLLVFAGNTVLYGTEPYVFDLSDAPASYCGVPTAMVTLAQTLLSESTSVEFTSDPNPFANESVVVIPGSRSDAIDMQIFTSLGYPLEKIKDIPANTEYRLGGTWKPGNYLVQIKRSGEVTTQQVIKK